MTVCNHSAICYPVRLFKKLTKSSKSPAEVAKCNKQWAGTCLYQKGYKPLLIQTAKQLFGYEQVAKADCEYPMDLGGTPGVE